MVANFSVGGAVWMVSELNLLVRISSHNKELEAQIGAAAVRNDPKEKEAIAQSIESISTILTAGNDLQELVKSGHIGHALDRLRAWTTDEPKSWSNLFTRACAVRDAVVIEFKDHLYYAYPKPKGQKVKNWNADWDKIHAAFPDVRTDSFSATDCYALNHPTASVFHSMRVAEAGLRALANERRIKLPKNKAIEWATWQEIITALDDEIRLIGRTWKAGRRKDAALAFYSGARADINGFKDEFRNLVMHVREQYDEHQAERALARVYDFMGRLADKLDHRHYRIKWGRAN